MLVASTRPIACDDIWKLPYIMRRFGGAYSTNSAVALPNSPPIEMPCTTRPSTTMMGARIPMLA